MIYAAYGSNMNITQMAKRCPAARKIGVGVIHGYELTFCIVATIRPCAGSNLPVVLWDITKGCEEKLDIYEGFPRLYIKENFKVDFEGKTIEAMAYIMAPPHCDRPALPNKYYLQTIIDGYDQNGIVW